MAEAWQEKPKDPKQAKAEQKHQDELKADAELGAKYAERADKELKPSKNQEYIDRVQRIGGELADIANKNRVETTWGDKRLNPYAYRFKVVEKEEVNAFSLPGGFIYVYEGLVKYCESDDELAGVLAHEIAHASMRHLATLQREQSKVDLFTLPLILISLLSGGDAGSAGITLGTLANQALASGWGQNAERAADYGGFQYMVRSRYNPVGMLTFMEKLARDQRSIEAIDWGIYRTHPPSKERAMSLQGFILGQRLPLKRSAVTTSFRVIPKIEDKGGVAMHFNTRVLFRLGGPNALDRAERISATLNDFFDEVPELYVVGMSGESTVTYRQRPLFQLTDVDAELTGLTLAQTTAGAVRSIKRELYMLAFRVWDAR